MPVHGARVIEVFSTLSSSSLCRLIVTRCIVRIGTYSHLLTPVQLSPTQWKSRLATVSSRTMLRPPTLTATSPSVGPRYPGMVRSPVRAISITSPSNSVRQNAVSVSRDPSFPLQLMFACSATLQCLLHQIRVARLLLRRPRCARLLLRRPRCARVLIGARRCASLSLDSLCIDWQRLRTNDLERRLTRPTVEQRRTGLWPPQVYCRYTLPSKLRTASSAGFSAAVSLSSSSLPCTMP